MARLNVKEAAAYVPCGVSTLNKLRTYGGGPAYSKPAGRILYETDELDRWVKDAKRSSTVGVGHARRKHRRK
jgi:hypothetical protein